MLWRIRSSETDRFYKDLLNKEPHVVSITFWRGQAQTQKDDDAEDSGKFPRLGIEFDNIKVEEEGERFGGDYQITAVENHPESLLYGMPIEVGDLLVSVNSQSCYGLDIDLVKEMILNETGIVTLTLRKTRMAPYQDELRLAIFIDSEKHTNIPQDICLFKEEKKLSVFALYNQFDMNQEPSAIDSKNDWLGSSCLSQGQVLLSINGTSSFQAEEDEAHARMEETLKSDKVLAIKTYAPSRASASYAPDMVERIISYIIQLENRTTRALEQARNDNDDLTFAASPYPIFTSAIQIDKVLRGGFYRCISITTGMPLFELYLVMNDIWGKYANILIKMFPRDSLFFGRKRLSAEEVRRLQQEIEEGIPSKREEEEKKENGEDELDKDASQKTADPEQFEKDSKPKQSKSWFFGSKNASHKSNPKCKPAEGREIDASSAKRSRSNRNRVNAVHRNDKEASIRAAICHVVCTGSYCMDQLKERENALKEKIDEEYLQQIDFGHARKVLQEEVIEKGIFELVDSVKHQVDPIFARMTRIKWHKYEEVGDTSTYVMQTVTLLKERLMSLSMQLPHKIHQKFSYLLLGAVCESFYFSLARINRISPVGTQQLLLDVCTMKLEFVTLLRISEPLESEVEKRMKDPQRFINEQLRNPEALLKLAVTNVGVDELLWALDGNLDETKDETSSGDEFGGSASASKIDDFIDGGSVSDESTIFFDNLEEIDASLKEISVFQEFDLKNDDPTIF